MPCGIELTSVAHPDLLPDAAARLFAPARGLDGVFAAADWYRTVIATALPEGDAAELVLATINRQPAALFPLARHADGRLQSLTTPYSLLYRPLVAPGLEARALERIGAALARHCRPAGGLRLEALADDDPILAPLAAGLRRGGLVGLRYDHFGNWHQPTAGMGWAAYLAAREGSLRETVRRRTARIARDPAIRLELFCTQEGLERGMSAFEDVYRRSWKEPEPFPRFNATLMRQAAAAGMLRLAVMWQGGLPIAAQYWVVADGEAAVLKLAHDEAFKPLSPGTVLTAWVIRALLDNEQVRELDFGRGDDPYKRQWATQRRQRIGIDFVDPRRLSGLSALLRHVAGQAARPLLHRWNHRKTCASPDMGRSGAMV